MGTNILLIDDNPIPTIKTVNVLLSKFSGDENYEITDKKWNKLMLSAKESSYNNFYGKTFNFSLNKYFLTVYFYNPKDFEKYYDETDNRLKKRDKNRLALKAIFEQKDYAYIWMDYGHSPIKILDNGNDVIEYQVNENRFEKSKSTDFLEFNTLTPYFDKAKQVAIYSYNPALTYFNTSRIRRDSWTKVKKWRKKNRINNSSQLKAEDLHFIETSEVLKIFDFKESLSDGLTKVDYKGKKVGFLGTHRAYEIYGELLGNILFDLFKQLQYKKSNNNTPKYNFFNKENLRFIKKVKSVNDRNFLGDKLKLGLISFRYKESENNHFLLDTPYKEYYENYDLEIQKIKELELIYKPDTFGNKKSFWIYYSYDKTDFGTYEAKFKVSTNGIKYREAARKFLPYLHTAVFYSPDFYSKAKPEFSFFDNPEESSICINSKKKEFKGVELIYYVNIIDILKNKGILHYAIFRNREGKFEAGNKVRYPEKLQYINKDYIEEINHNFGKPILIPLVEDTIFPVFEKQLRSHSLLNALSTVLNRNGSHNLGSHVLAVLSDEGLVNDFLNGSSKNLVRYSPVFLPKIGHHYKLISDLRRNNNDDFPQKAKNDTISQIAYFNAYLKNRLDLLAAVGTSGETVMLNNKPFFQAVFKNFERNQILLEHISGKRDDFLYRFSLQVNNVSAVQLNDEGKFEINNDIEVAIPNDLLGDQAFYLLLENVIRNTAKHGIYDSNKEVVFTINICDNNNDFYSIEVSDNNCLQKRFKFEKENRKQDTEFKDVNDIIKETNARIDKDILKDDFNIREGGWGTIEMKIACCYLSGIPLRKIDDNIYRTATSGTALDTKRKLILEAFLKKNKETKKLYLGYRFYIQKPKSVLVIDVDNILIKNAKYKASLKNKGIDILSKSELDKATNSRTVFKHQFIIAFALEETKQITDFMKDWFMNKQLPNRCLFINEENLINMKLLETCYKIELDKANPLKKNIEGDKYIININDDFEFYGLEEGEFKLLKSSKKIEYDFEGKFTLHAVARIQGKKIYSEPYGSASSIGLYLNDRKNSDKINKIYFELLESIKKRVLVIDERVQNGLDNTFVPDKDSGDAVKFGALYLATKIIVPRKVEDGKPLNLNKPQDFIENIRNYIKDKIQNEDIDFFILHFGILEKIVKNGDKEKFKKYLDECRNYSKFPIKIVLTSGRGIPGDLPIDEYFCNFSSINYYITDSSGRSKVHLTQLLQNQRAK